MIVKTRCEDGCSMGEKTNYVVCSRCSKAVKREVESEQERQMRLLEEERAFIQMAEDSRETILSRMEALEPHDRLLVNLYVGGEWRKRGYPSPLTRLGRALGIILMAEAMMAVTTPKKEETVGD